MNIPYSHFALNRPTDKLPTKLNNFQRIAHKFNSVLMMSNSDEEALMQVKQSTPSKVRSADEAGPSTAPAVRATPSTPNTDTTTVTSPSTDDLYTDAFTFALSRIFSSTLMASLTTKARSSKKNETASWRKTRIDANKFHHISILFGRICTSKMDACASMKE